MAKESAQQRAARVAAERAAQSKAERTRNIRMVAIVVVAMVAIIGGGFALSKIGSGGSSTVEDSAAAAKAGSVTIGSDDAKNKVIIYEDFLCKYCGEMERASSAQLAELADAGQVQVTYRPFHLLQAEYSRNALEVFQVLAHTSTPEITNAFHTIAFERQPAETQSAPGLDEIVGWAVEAGADEAAVRSGLAGDAGKWADEATNAAADAGVQSTPTVLLNGVEFTEGNSIQDRVASLLDALA